MATITCGYTGVLQSVTIPTGVSSVQITADGAEGGNDVGFGNGGLGGQSQGTLAVTGGEVLTVMVGGQGGNGDSSLAAGAGGYGGGGNGSSGTYDGGAGGGGGSFVWDSAGNLALAAGGGGGAGWESINSVDCTGAGGGTTGGSDTCIYDGTGAGGGQTGGGNYGGTGPASWSGGSPLAGQGGSDPTSSGWGGGGGGGGYYGGGSANGTQVGGGGGSGYLSSGLGSGTMTSGVNAGNGTVTVSFAVTAPSFGTSPCQTLANLPFSCVFTATGSPTPTWSELGALPTGVTFTDNGDGTATLGGITGQTGTFPVQLTASNMAGTETQGISVEVDSPATFTSAPSTAFSAGAPASFTVVTSGGYPAPALTEVGTLPPGITFTDNGNGTATLAGTPSQGGTFPLTFQATNAAGTASQSFTLTVNQAPSITSAAAAGFPPGSTSSFTVTTVGYPTPSITETGPLPSGLNFVDNGDGTATISGQSTSVGLYQVLLTATNTTSTASQVLYLCVCSQVSVTSPAEADFVSGSASSFTVTTSGAPAPSLSESGTLPSGITFNDNGNGTATLAGTSTETGTYPLTITASNVAGNVYQDLALVIGGKPRFTTKSSAGVRSGSPLSFTVKTSGTPTATLSESGTLPAGITFTDQGNGEGLLSGTATTAGHYVFNVTATNIFGSTTQSFALTVEIPPKLTAVKTTELLMGKSALIHLSARGYPAAVLSLSGKLPAGLSFRDTGNGTATISGVAKGAGIYPLTLVAKNAGGEAVEHFRLVVVSITGETPGKVTAGKAGVLVTVRGQGFDRALKPSIHALAKGLKVRDLIVKSPSEITFRLTVARTVPPGKYRLVLEQDGRRLTFEVTVTKKKAALRHHRRRH